MPGVKGQIRRSAKGKQKSVYLSNVLGLWEEQRGRLHLASLVKGQSLHISISKKDGLLFDVMFMLYHHGMAVGSLLAAPEQAVPNRVRAGEGGE